MVTPSWAGGLIRMAALPHRTGIPAGQRPRGRGRLAAAAALALAAAFAGPLPAQTSDIPWNSTLVISRTSANDDIRNVLRSILQANGLSAVFGPDVQGPISFQQVRVISKYSRRQK